MKTAAVPFLPDTFSVSACTRLLWETYHPQYYTWIPFAVIGVLATIALAIYGRMAKRWSDMNA